MRRLPIYFLIDTKSDIKSGSIQERSNGINIIISRFKQSAALLECGFISLNSLFENNQINQLIPIYDIGNCELIARDRCCLGKAISLLAVEEMLKGDFAPIVIIFLFDYPEDNFIKYIEKYKKVINNTIIIYYGQNHDIEKLKLITGNIIDGNNLDLNNITRHVEMTFLDFEIE